MALPGFAAAAPPVFTIQTIAGGEYRDKAVLALAAQPARVERIGISSKGVMYLADTAAHRVRKITPDGLTQNGTGSAGPQARLNPPFAVETNFRATSTSTISATTGSADISCELHLRSLRYHHGGGKAEMYPRETIQEIRPLGK